MPTFETKLTHPQAKERLSKLPDLVRGWDSYGAEPPTELAVRCAGRYIDAAYRAKLPATKVAPSVVGGIGITFRKDANRYAYVEWLNDGRGFVIFSDRLGGELPDGIAVHALAPKAYLLPEMAAFLS